MASFYHLLRGLALIVLLQLFATQLQAQEIDQLKASIGKVQGKARVEKYLQIGILSSEKYAQVDSLLHYANLAFGLSKKIHYSTGELKSQLYRGIAYQQLNAFDSADVILKRVIAAAGKRKEYGIQNDACFHLGLAFFRSGNNTSAIEYYVKAIGGYKKTRDADGMALTYARLAGLFTNESQGTEAKDYLHKALRLLPDLQKPFVKISVNSSIAGTYIQLSDQSPKYLDSSIYFAQQSFRLMKEYGYLTKANQICNSISDAYYLKKNFHKSLAYCIESLKYRDYLFPGEIIISYMKYSDCENELGNYTNALRYLDSVYIALQQIDDAYYRMAYYERVHQFNKNAGQFEAAMRGLERYKSIQDSLFNIDKSASINELINKYNKVENEKEISILSKQNEINNLNVKMLVIGIVSALLFIIILIFFFRQNRLKSQFKMLQSEQRLNRARIEPHFFFNALTSIQTNAIQEQSPKTASLLAKFSKIMRQSLDSTYDEMTVLEDEISFLEQYIELQLIRREIPFRYDIHLEENVDPSDTLIPSMLLQPMVENSIEHGFRSARADYALRIAFARTENQLQIIVEDNGDGATGKMAPTHTSRASQIMKDRLLLLEKLTRKRTRFEIKANAEGGYLVTIYLPFLTRE